MAGNSIKDAPLSIPDGYVPIPLSAEQAASPLRLCAVVKKQPDPVAGHLVLLRDLLDAKVYMGCVVDSLGRLQQWTEIWVQTVDVVGGMASVGRESVTNKAMDERWKRQVESYERLDPSAVIRTGWETQHPRPLLLDLGKLAGVNPEADGQPWVLCQNDQLLTAKGLPGYSTSPHRYLFVEGKGGGPTFVAISDHAPFVEGVKPLTELRGGRTDLIPFNPGAGLMFVKAYNQLSYETFVDLTGGATSAGIPHGKSVLSTRGDAPTGGNDAAGLAGEGWLYLGKHGRSGRLLETLHLKLKAISDVLETVRTFTREHQRPLLNLTADTFQVRLGMAGSGLPTLWTASVVLADPGDAVELGIEGTQAKYFMPGRAATSSIYRPAVATAPISGRCTVRIRQVLPEAKGVVLEGTLVTQERIVPGKNDLVWLRLNMGGGGIDLYATLEEQAALARGEYRFRTVSQRLSPEIEAQVKSAQGVPLGNTVFELLAQMSTPCDLYGIAVLAVRTLISSERNALAVALDETLSLAQQVAVEYDPAVPLPRRIASIFERDTRWMASLGPQHIVKEEVTPEEAFDLVPAEVWWDVLGAVVRMIPGVGPDSVCMDFGDAPPGGLHKVFDAACADLHSLLVRTRSLIVIDWRANREIHAVIRGFVTGLK
jgi:hypothetical protein